MIFPKAKKIAKKLDWHVSKNGVFGIYKNYFFNVSDAHLLNNPQFKFVEATVDNLTDEKESIIRTELIDNKKDLKYSSFEVHENRIYIKFIENLSFTKLKIVYSLLDFLVDLFNRVGLPEQNKCHNCDSKVNNDYYTLNDKGLILCDVCSRQIKDNIYEKEREQISLEKNYFFGFLGSILFSILGIIAWVLIAVYLELIASIMSMVIAYLGYSGYNFFKGRNGGLTKYIILISNIICIVFANIATIITLLIQEGLTLSESIAEFQINEIALDMFYKNTLISFTLALVIWLSILFNPSENKPSFSLAKRFNSKSNRP